MPKTLDKRPDYKKIEAKWQRFWRTKKIYKFNPNSRKPVFSIDTPPPYISGKLHMGHGASYTMFETIARFKRMTGHNVFFPIGFDDNGLPTERYIEQKLGIKSTKMSRQKFIKIALKETKKLEKSAREMFDRFGHSYDWDLFYSTISPRAAKVAQKSFLDLYRKGRVYRSSEPGLYSISGQTGISQADLEDQEQKTFLNYINFKVGNTNLQIATTRPELIPACVAVFVNPKHPTYSKFVGKHATVPLTNDQVPILADKDVKIDFGTGALMVCTFGDKTDVEWWKKYKLPLKVIIDRDGRLNEEAGKFEGLTLGEARNKILSQLDKEGLLKKRDKIKQTVQITERYGDKPEYLILEQWQFKLTDLKAKLLKKAREVNWTPKHYYNNLRDWTENLQWDWVLSRQRHIGIPIPVWYDEQGNVFLPEESELPVDPTKDKPKKHKGKKLLGEKDVFDTWMTSSLTPEIAMGWAENERLFNKNTPMSLRPQGLDIIRTWAFYTLLKSLVHHNDVPWKNIVINGMVLDPHGRKMSKSKGNGIDPLEQVEKYNADAFRYYTTTTLYGENSPYQEKELVRGTKLMNKLWNTAKFTFMNFDNVPSKKPRNLELEDKWILAKLSRTQERYLEYFDNYQIKQARQELENFFLHDFCDFYLEMIKSRIYGEDKQTKYAAQWTTYNTLYGILQMFAPIFVHLTEELYQNLYKKEKKTSSIHLTQYETLGIKDAKSEALGDFAKNIISEIRQWKQSNKIRLGDTVDQIKIEHPQTLKIKQASDVICRTTRVNEILLKRGGKLKITN
ncbi:MAG: valine--tRNA ligase [uncultured DHVE6 group euryarchaeote]|nr:MAG: valine--tRNA ligase [uncultured DHVE6 group euryarchaeote]